MDEFEIVDMWDDMFPSKFSLDRFKFASPEAKEEAKHARLVNLGIWLKRVVEFCGQARLPPPEGHTCAPRSNHLQSAPGECVLTAETPCCAAPGTSRLPQGGGEGAFRGRRRGGWARRGAPSTSTTVENQHFEDHIASVKSPGV